MKATAPDQVNRDCEHDPAALTVDAARQRLLSTLQPIADIETVALPQALGRVLAQNIVTPYPVPSFANSAMDGYALKAEDLPTSTQGLRVIGTSLAGHPYQGEVAPGTCVRIMTGAALPEGADTVIMQEQVEIRNDILYTTRAEPRGVNVRHAGEEFAANATVLTAGHRIAAAHIGLLAQLGSASVPVHRRLRVALLSTGDELVPLGQTLKPGQIHDSNRYTLTALLATHGYDLLDLGCVPDNRERIAERLAHAAQTSDAIITTGGVSVGDADHTKAALENFGDLVFWKIAMKPGRPLAFGHIKGKPCFGLPGNPVSAVVTFHQFVLPALQKLSGATPAPPLRFQVTCASRLKKKPGRQEFQRGQLFLDANGTYQVKSTGQQSSSMLSSLAQSNCYIVLPEDSSGTQAGDTVWVELFPNT